MPQERKPFFYEPHDFFTGTAKPCQHGLCTLRQHRAAVHCLQAREHPGSFHLQGLPGEARASA